MSRTSPALCLPAVTIALILFSPGAMANRCAESGFTPQFRPTLAISPARGAIRIDGSLDDPGWEGAARASGFSEVSPGDQVRPPVESEVWVTYDTRNLYVALIAYDDPGTVRYALRNRDEIFSDDYFGVMLDTYGDHAWAYELFVNPLGIQGDLRMMASGEEDIAFDLVWHSMGRVTDHGYQVEIAIPFASLRFPDNDEHSWRINLWRDHQRGTRRRYAWAATDRDNPCFMCNWGTLTGIRDISHGSRMEIIASAIGQQHGRLQTGNDPSSGFSNRDPAGEASASLRYSLGSNASVEITVNPDFSQIESDAGQIDINEPYALFYDEHRPFFQEGSDLYSTRINTMYTRSINDPAVAARLTARPGRLALAYTFARDDRSPILIPTEERTFILMSGRSVSNILRARRTIGENSHIGFMATDRRLDDGGSGTVLGADAMIRFRRNWRADLQYAFSRTDETDDPDPDGRLEGVRLGTSSRTAALDGEILRGHALYAGLRRSSRHWSADLEYREFSPEFRADNGFITRNDYRQVSASTGINCTPNRRVLVSIQPGVSAGRIWDMANRFQDEWIRPSVNLELTRQTSLRGNYLWSRERFRERIFDGISAGYLEVNGRMNGRFAYGFGGRAGRVIWRSFHADPVLGRSLNLFGYLNLRPTARLQFTPRITHSSMRHPVTDAEIFSGYILRGRLDYLFSRKAAARLVAEYDRFGNGINLEPLFTYRANALTVFYLGMSMGYLELESPAIAGGPAGRGGDADWHLSRRQVFAKLQYMFRV